MILRKLWGLRFHGWPWLFVPVLLGLLLALCLMAEGVLGMPRSGTLTVCFGITLFSIVVAMIGMWAIGRPVRALLAAARALASGRAEARAPTGNWGITGELGTAINQLARQISAHGDQLDQAVTQATARLQEDVERLQAQNQEMRTALTESRGRTETLSELFSNLSHELRTPLTAVLGYTDLLRRSGLNRAQETHLATLDKSARAMLKMINDLLDWSRIEAGRLRLNEESFDVQEAAEDIIEMLAPQAYEKDLELVRIVYHDVPRRLRGDAQRLRQILINLVSNAIKFTTRGEVVLRIMREREERGRAWISCSVTDTGDGIAPEQQRRLFQPFQQARGTRGGSGLGLTITRRLAELMGGRVDLQSSAGLGSTFSVTLPFALAGEAQPDSISAGKPLRERHAWLLEPHPISRLALAHRLESWGLRVRSFDTAQALSDTLDSGSPDIAIAGLREKDAAEPVYQALFQRCQSRRPPLLVLIASASITLHTRVREAGAAVCLPKSIGQSALLRELSGLLCVPAGLRSQQPAPLGGRSVLIADNNAPTRLYVAALCRELGLHVTECADGGEALRQWRGRPTDFVLLDARMPGLDGLACTRAIRAEDPAQRSRIIAISAHLEPDERSAFLGAGAGGVLIKPFDNRELLRSLSPLAAAPPPVSATLAADPELLALLRAELPQQIGEVEHALNSRDLDAARDAAHQLRGSVAFYHIASLKQAASALEQHLRKIGDLAADEGWRPRMAEVHQAFEQTLGDLSKRGREANPVAPAQPV